MKKDLYDAMIRLCVDSFNDINWEWDGLTTSERIAIGSKEIFHKLHKEASDFLIVKPSPHYEAFLMRCNSEYADKYCDDVHFFTSVKDHWVSEWVIFKMPEAGAEYEDWEEQDFYFENKDEAIEKAEELNNPKILCDSDSQQKENFHVVLIECSPDFEKSFPTYIDPVWTKVGPDLAPLWTIFREPYYATDKIEWVSINVFFDSISVAHDSLAQLKQQQNQSHGS